MLRLNLVTYALSATRDDRTIQVMGHSPRIIVQYIGSIHAKLEGNHEEGGRVSRHCSLVADYLYTVQNHIMQYRERAC